MTSKRRDSTQVSITRALSKLGYASRSIAGGMVREGRVAVNGRPVTSLRTWLDLRHDRITIDGRLLRPRRSIYLAMNKPPGVVTTRSDEQRRGTVYDLLPDATPWLFPVGRLDKESRGLLLFTNDVRFGEELTSPERHVPKTYRVQLDRPLAGEHRRVMEQGMRLRDGTNLRGVDVVIRSDDARVMDLTLREGKNRQIRRMAEELGYVVLDLVRIRIGNIGLGTLQEGAVRRLTESEVAVLMKRGRKHE